LENESLNLSDILILDEAGLIKQNGLSCNINYKEDIDEIFILYQNNIVFIKRNNKQVTKISIPCYVLTESGKEIYSIIKKSFQESYIKNVAIELKKQNFTISYNKIIKIDDNNSITYDNNSIAL